MQTNLQKKAKERIEIINNLQKQNTRTRIKVLQSKGQSDLLSTITLQYRFKYLSPKQIKPDKHNPKSQNIKTQSHTKLKIKNI